MNRRKPPSRLRPIQADHVSRDLRAILSDPGVNHEGRTALCVCPRIGSVVHIPRNYQAGNCSECGHPVWLNSDVVLEVESRRMVVRALCTHCLNPIARRSPKAG